MRLNDAIAKLLRLMSPQERRRLPWLLVAILAMALLQTATIASIMPFIAVATQPDIVVTNPTFRALHDAIGAPDLREWLIYLGLAVLGSLLVSNVFSVFVTWLLLRYSHMVGHRFSRRVLGNYLHQSYDFFLNRNSAELTRNILSEADRVTRGVLVPLLTAISRCVTIAFIVTLLVFADPLIALVVSSVLGIAYLGVYLSIRRKALELGRRATEASKGRFQITAEAFGIIKSLKLMGLEDQFTERFAQPSRRYSRYHALGRALSQLPKFLLEVVAFGGVLIAVIYVISTRGTLDQALSLLALYAFAGYRLLPQLQQIFDVASSVRFNLPALEALLADFPDTPAGAGQDDAETSLAEPLTFAESLELADVSYTYPGTAAPTVTNVCLTVNAGTTVGLAGSTGAGKTTVADLLLGLLSPQSGSCIVDGQPLTNANVRSWQAQLSYVPQHIFLTDDTIRQNIALGVPPQAIDDAAVEHAARRAQLHRLIDDFPDGLNTVVGERGVRLSGGEQQRIGIARALYRGPRLLVLDEATSALDALTEKAVLEEIALLNPAVTVVMITHRLSSLAMCDEIFLFEHGELTASGAFDQLVSESPQFANLAGAN